MGADTPVEIPLRAGGTRAVISTAAGAPRILEVDGAPLLHGFPSGHWPGSVNALLSPWPNRVDGGLFRHLGREHRLEIDEPERGNAIHGLAWRTLFRVRQRAADSVTLEALVGPAPGWPWPLRHVLRHSVVPGALEASLVVRNEAAEPAPLAVGVHLFPDAAGAPLDDCRLRHGLRCMLPLDATRLLPSPPERPAAEVLGPGSGTPMSGLRLDHAFREDRGGTAERVRELLGPRGGVRVSTSPEFHWTQLYTSPERHLAVEPMTAPPNALADGVDLLRLPPGGEREFRWRVEFIPPAAAAPPGPTTA